MGGECLPDCPIRSIGTAGKVCVKSLQLKADVLEVSNLTCSQLLCSKCNSSSLSSGSKSRSGSITCVCNDHLTCGKSIVVREHTVCNGVKVLVVCGQSDNILGTAGDGDLTCVDIVLDLII